MRSLSLSLSVVVTVVLVSPALSELACKNWHGVDVDWWTGYKMTSIADNLTEPGYAMAYWDAFSTSAKHSSGLQWYWENIRDHETKRNETTALFHTTMQLPYMGGSPDTGFLIYNDQQCYCPEGKTCFRALMQPNKFLGTAKYWCPTAYNRTAVDPVTHEPYNVTKCQCNHMPGAGNFDGNYRVGDYDTNGKKYGHAKGFLMFNGKQGLWMIHSVPGFPLSPDNFKRNGGWGWYKLGPGQHFHCMTLTRGGVEQVARLLKQSYVLPQGLPAPAGERTETPSFNVPEALRSQYPNVYALVSDKGRLVSPPNGPITTELQTLRGVNIRAFAKSGDDGLVRGEPGTEGQRTGPGTEKYQTMLWEDIVAPGLQTPLLVETWCKLIVQDPYDCFNPYYPKSREQCGTLPACAWASEGNRCEPTKPLLQCEHNESCSGSTKCEAYVYGSGKKACERLDSDHPCIYEAPLEQCGESGCICDAKKARQDRLNPYVCAKSTCDAKFPVMQIEQLDWSGTIVTGRFVSSIFTHAKWAISNNETKPWVCWGDINRQAEQQNRGGGTACMWVPSTWKMLHDIMIRGRPGGLVSQYDHCQ